MIVSKLASSQHGVASRRQLIDAGASEGAVDRMIAARRLHPLHAGVYAVGHPLVSGRGKWMGAVLACGDDAVLSFRSAAALLDLRRSSSPLIEVTIPRGSRRKRDGIRIHEARSLPSNEVTTHEGIPCTTVARTLVDLAAVLPARALERAIERAQILHLFDLTSITAAVNAANGRRGTKTLRRLLADLTGEPPPTRNDLERDFLDLVRSAGLPEPITNGIVLDKEVDFHWPAQRVIVETDGRETHDTAIAFERDRRRDLQLTLAGWHVIRVSWRQLRTDAEAVTATLRRVLAG